MQAELQDPTPLIRKLAGRLPSTQFLRYLLVGAWNTLFGYATYALLTALLTPHLRYGYMLASALSSLLNITVAFFGYKFFVFKTRGSFLKEWLRCLLVYGSSLVPGLVALPFLVQVLRTWFHMQRGAPYAAGAVVMFFTVIYSFIGHKKFSFRASKQDAPSPAGEGPAQQAGARPGDIRDTVELRR